MPDAMLALAGARVRRSSSGTARIASAAAAATPTRDKRDEYAKECPTCGLVAYPRVSPAMMALVTRGREMLLARSRRFATVDVQRARGLRRGRAKRSRTASSAKCARKSASRSTGLRYFGSQSWAFPHSLMIAFTAEYAGGDIRLDDDEIVDARWFARRRAAADAARVSIARQLIDATAARLAASLTHAQRRDRRRLARIAD